MERTAHNNTQEYKYNHQPNTDERELNLHLGLVEFASDLLISYTQSLLRLRPPAGALNAGAYTSPVPVCV